MTSLFLCARQRIQNWTSMNLPLVSTCNRLHSRSTVFSMPVTGLTTRNIGNQSASPQKSPQPTRRNRRQPMPCNGFRWRQVATGRRVRRVVAKGFLAWSDWWPAVLAIGNPLHWEEFRGDSTHPTPRRIVDRLLLCPPHKAVVAFAEIPARLPTLEVAPCESLGTTANY